MAKPSQAAPPDVDEPPVLRTDEEVRGTIARNITRFREAAGLNMAELARKAGVTTIQVSRVERGMHSPGVGLSLRIAQALGVTVEDLAAPPSGS
ncbi:MAG TPA: helix-turn-helix transcriptional regulator [Pirellulales bacterium]|nr:helix-turn-helix transcriptional regulator [Pirellulales bacterium]